MFEVGKWGKESVLLIDVNEEKKRKKKEKKEKKGKKGRECKWINKYKIILN